MDRTTCPVLLAGICLVATLVPGSTMGDAADDDADLQKALGAAAQFLGLPATDLRLDEIIREPWRYRYEFLFEEYRGISVVMPECKVLCADLTERWTREHGEEILGPIDDEGAARGIAERFVAKHYLPLPPDWTSVEDGTPAASAKFYDYTWLLCYKGVRVEGAWYGVSVSAKAGRVNLCTSSSVPVRVSLTPKVTQDEARAVTEEELKRMGLAGKPRRRLQHSWLTVGYFPRNARPTARNQRLAWDIVYEFPYSEEYLKKQDEETRKRLEAGPPAAWFSVDARSGEVIHKLVREMPEEE